MRKNKEDPPDDYVTIKLCEAYRQALREEIRGIRNTLIVGLSISSSIITIVTAIIQLVLR